MAKVKRFNHPAYKVAEWEGLNPILRKGELGVELTDLGVPDKMKIGDGATAWISLGYIEEATYGYSQLATVNIGDINIGDSHQGDALDSILLKIISPFVEPTISSASNDADGVQSNLSIREVGQSVDTSVDIAYVVTTPSNLVPTNNIFIAAGGIFSNEGALTHGTGTETMTLISSLSPSGLTTYTIGVYAIFSGGISPTVNTSISFRPAQLWGSSANDSLIDISDDTIAQNLTSFPEIDQRKVTNVYTGDYIFTTVGYSYMLVPDMLSPSNLAFTEVTNPNQPANYSMIWQGTALINNGTGTYKYHVYRSEFELIFGTKMRIS